MRRVNRLVEGDRISGFPVAGCAERAGIEK
jgi:hypothetical protein